MAAAKAKVSQYDRRVIETKALRGYVPQKMRPLFDHLLELAAHSHKSGYAKRAGRELAHARKLAAKPIESKAHVVKLAGGHTREFELERVKLDRGGYDARGRYFGVGQPLFRATVPVNGDEALFRAKSAAEAKKTVAWHLKQSGHLDELRRSGGTPAAAETRYQGLHGVDPTERF